MRYFISRCSGPASLPDVQPCPSTSLLHNLRPVRLHCVPLTSRTPFSAEHGFMLEVCRVLSYVVCLSVSFSVIFCDMLAELEELDKSRAWPRLFQVRCPCLFLNFRQIFSIHQCLMLTCLLVNWYAVVFVVSLSFLFYFIRSSDLIGKLVRKLELWQRQNFRKTDNLIATEMFCHVSTFYYSVCLWWNILDPPFLITISFR